MTSKAYWLIYTVLWLTQLAQARQLCHNAKDCQTQEVNRMNLEVARETAKQRHEKLDETELEENGVPFDGDMLIDKPLAQAIRESLTSRRTKRKIIDFSKYKRNKWSTTIKYRFDGTHDQEQQTKIRTAIRMWEDTTCMRFQETREADPDHHLVFNRGAGCMSFVGQSTSQNPQPVFLNENCLLLIGTPAHEIGHALGLFHEHSRPDRDDYIYVNHDNLYAGNKGNFAKLSFLQAVTKGLPYDFGSVMHYEGRAFSRNEAETLVTRDRRYQRTIGQRQEISFVDAKAINLEYCSDRCNADTLELPCENGGYQDPKYCERCICPDGFEGNFCQRLATAKGGGSCGGTLYASDTEQSLQSPGYDTGSYRDGQECTWVIKASQQKKVEVRFDGEFGMFCPSGVCMHFVELKFKSDISNTGPRFCSKERPRDVVISERPQMVVLMRASSELVADQEDRRGFRLLYKQVTGEVCNPDPCLNGGTCTPSGPKTCACPSGYSGDVCEQVTGEVDGNTPCARRPCLNGGRCLEEGTGYRCQCAEGYSGVNCQTRGPVTDPCARNPCLNNGRCYREGSSYGCQCPEGFTGSRCETREQVTDPCARNPCYNNGRCYREGNSYRCQCPEGFTGARCETQRPVTDPCARNPCYNNGRCYREGNSYRCQCPDGFTGARCETQRPVTDPCARNPCYNNGRCYREGNSYRCQCPDGFTGARCETQRPVTDPCARNPCYNNGRCYREGNSYRCQCPEGFTGARCETQRPGTDPCARNPCYNNGRCYREGNSYRCQCPEGFTGARCETREQVTDPCGRRPCLNNGRCLREGNSYRCQCPEGFTGENCQTGNPCNSRPCRNGGTCYNTGAGFTCRCREGYSGRKCETGNPCSGRPCWNGGTCYNTGSGFTCYCREGYSGRRCETRNPCNSRPCRNGGTCYNTGSGFTCRCREGYSGKQCENRNPCSSDPCRNDGTCFNTGSTFTCRCREGYRGRQCETYENPCSSRPCRNGGWCRYLGTNFQCVCRPEFTGRYCETEVQACGSSPCRNGGTCYNSGRGFVCRCREGYSGRQCESDNNPCQSRPCMNDGQCYPISGGRYYCYCGSGFSGERCQTVTDPCARTPCRHGGYCQRTGWGSYRCQCPRGYTGNNCEEPDPCSRDPCMNGGSCYKNKNSFQCVCPWDFYGRTCEQRSGLRLMATTVEGNSSATNRTNTTGGGFCAYNPCRNGGTCRETGDDYRCDCPENYQGENCEVEIVRNACESNPCKNGARCVQADRAFICECPRGYTGDRCDKRAKDCGGCGTEQPGTYPACYEPGNDVVKVPYGCCKRTVKRSVPVYTRYPYRRGSSERIRGYRNARRRFIGFCTRTLCVEHGTCYREQRQTRAYCCDNAIKLNTWGTSYCIVQGWTEWSRCSRNCGGCGKRKRFHLSVANVGDRQQAQWYQSVEPCNFKACSNRDRNYRSCTWYMRMKGYCDSMACCSGYTQQGDTCVPN